jgi:hypothetical protein
MAGTGINCLAIVLKELGWSYTRLIAELRRHSSIALPKTESMVTLIGCSASVCPSSSQGPITHRPQPSIGQPHCSQGWPGSCRPSSWPAGAWRTAGTGCRSAP